MNHRTCSLGASTGGFGAAYEAQEAGFEGEISKFRIYRGALNAADVAALYAKEKLVLEFAWLFAGAHSDVVVDTVGGVEALLVNGTVRTAGGVALDGKSSYVDLNLHSFNRTIGGAFTVELVFTLQDVSAAAFDNTDANAPLFACSASSSTDIDADTVMLWYGVLVPSTPPRLFSFVGRRWSDPSSPGCNSSNPCPSALTNSPIDDAPARKQYHYILTNDGNESVVYVDGVRRSAPAVAYDTRAPLDATFGGIQAWPNYVTRDHCYIGGAKLYGSEYFLNGTVSLVRMYSGAMSAAQAQEAYDDAATVLSTVTGTPTATPSAAPSAPTSEPTASPTAVIASVLDYDASTPTVLVEYDETPVTVISVITARTAAVIGEGNTATLTCASNDAVLTPTKLTISAQSEAQSISAVAIPDRAQLAQRAGSIACEITAPHRVAQQLTISLAIRGVAQPSLVLICTLLPGEDAASPSLPENCAQTLTTNGNTSIVLVGGVCATCPQPPFDDGTTLSIGGVEVETAPVAGSGGARMLARTPSIRELVGANGSVDSFEFKCVAACSCRPRTLAAV